MIIKIFQDEIILIERSIKNVNKTSEKNFFFENSSNYKDSKIKRRVDVNFSGSYYWSLRSKGLKVIKLMASGVRGQITV